MSRVEARPEHRNPYERMQAFDYEVSLDYWHHTYCLARRALTQILRNSDGQLRNPPVALRRSARQR